ncbi:hypothetical protein F2P81_023617 [Scophthalmus maximus]|uniref:Uncharacterized protein n=1 Tax=Scophthalmus maximus TaxID=52904 RepID=A0A6A4RXG9_SCOMX|nr:hypothetical protein F2P81_023617 [Scophthalmus maximus]
MISPPRSACDSHVYPRTYTQLLGFGEEEDEEEDECQKSQRDTSCPKMPQAMYQEVSTSGPPAGFTIPRCLWAHDTQSSALQTQSNLIESKGIMQFP